jgi:hypothetical protein
MPWNNANQILVGANGQLYLAAASTAAPTDISSAVGAGWSGLGFVSEAGASITDGKEITDIGAWQSFYPARKLVTAREFSIAFALRQWNGFNVKFSFGGGTIASQGGGKWKYDPPSASTIDERAFLMDWQDGTKNYRLYVARGLASANTEATLARTAASDLAITFSALSDGTTSPYVLYTDDPSFAQSS